VFDPFFTTKDVGEGTGLGLDTARRITTERLGGSIELDSAPGRTAFHIWLPLNGPKS
jgi:signal transduction histidine kinase